MTLINKAFCEEAKDQIVGHLVEQLKGTANSNFFNLKDSNIDVNIRTTPNSHTKLTKFEVYVANQMVGADTIKLGGKFFFDKSFIDNLGTNIFSVLLAHIVKDSGFNESIDNMLRGITTANEVESPYGVTIKFHTDDDHQVMLLTKGKEVLYALEEAVNLDEGVGTDLFTPIEQLKGRIGKVLRHYSQRDDFAVEYEFSSDAQF